MRERLMVPGKWQRRLALVAASGANTLLLPLLNPLVAFLVVRLASADLWGAFVGPLVIAQFAAHVVGWGNRDYLLRAFSRDPAGIAPLWRATLVTRLALFAAGAPLALLLLAPGLLSQAPTPPARAAWLCAWVLALVLDQSFDVLVVYRRAFVYAAGVELAALAALAAAVAWHGAALTLDTLLVFFTLDTLLKIALFALRFRDTLWGRLGWGRFDARFFMLAFPFFLLGFSGMVQSRADLYAVTAYLPKSDVARYQVFVNLLIYLQTVANFVLTPFLKSLFRLSYAAISRLSLRLLALGALVMVAALPAIYLVLVAWYHFDVAPALVALGGLVVLPVFFYLPVIYALYKAGQQARVVAVNALGIAVSLGLALALLPPLGLTGAVLANAAGQWLMGAAYWWLSRRWRDEDAVSLPGLP